MMVSHGTREPAVGHRRGRAGPAIAGDGVVRGQLGHAARHPGRVLVELRQLPRSLGHPRQSQLPAARRVHLGRDDPPGRVLQREPRRHHLDDAEEALGRGGQRGRCEHRDGRDQDHRRLGDRLQRVRPSRRTSSAPGEHEYRRRLDLARRAVPDARRGQGRLSDRRGCQDVVRSREPVRRVGRRHERQGVLPGTLAFRGLVRPDRDRPHDAAGPRRRVPRIRQYRRGREPDHGCMGGRREGLAAGARDRPLGEDADGRGESGELERTGRACRARLAPTGRLPGRVGVAARAGCGDDRLEHP